MGIQHWGLDLDPSSPGIGHNRKAAAAGMTDPPVSAVPERLPLWIVCLNPKAAARQEAY
jgi:hypothetical protein